MQTFRLTINWKNTPAITIRKTLATQKEANWWAKICLDICGKNYLNEKCESWELTEESPMRIPAGILPIQLQE